jgi:hypothetical protein
MFTAANFMAPSYSELVRHSSFVSLDVECLHDMLGSDLIDMDEADVFLSVVRSVGLPGMVTTLMRVDRFLVCCAGVTCQPSS